MKTIQEDIKSRNFKRLYVIYGSESFLVRRYAYGIKKAAIGEGNDINFSYFDSDSFEINLFIDAAETMPFFADYRVVMLDGCSLSDDSDRITAYLGSIPESTIIIVMPKSVDKRTGLYKAFTKYGYVSDMSAVTPQMRIDLVVSEFSKAGKKISRSTADYYVNYVGGDLNNLLTEAGKLIDFIGDRNTVTVEDINEICTGTIENRIYDLIIEICNHRENNAFAIYFDLMELKESPMRIIRNLMSEYLTLYSLCELKERGASVMTMSEETGIRDWIINKKLALVAKMSREQIKRSVEILAETEAGIKTGNLDMETGAQIMLADLLIL